MQLANHNNAMQHRTYSSHEVSQSAKSYIQQIIIILYNCQNKLCMHAYNLYNHALDMQAS